MSNIKGTVIYVTREIERALGMTPNANYQIVSNRSTYAESIKKQFPAYVTLIEGPDGIALGTGELLRHKDTQELVQRITASTNQKPYILVFKNTARIEPIVREFGWTLINPHDDVSEKIENKLTQITWLSELTRHLPPHRIDLMRNVIWNNKPFIIQWAHGHTGGGTLLIESEADLVAVKTKFPYRRCRITDYIKGASFTVNVVVSPEKVAPSSISYQITGLPPFTESRFATVGNDWGLAKKILTVDNKRLINDIIIDIGAKMQKECWRGLFGIDLIREDATGKIFLIEINARQPASTTYESILQEALRKDGASGSTTFEAHLTALLGEPIGKPIIEITDGAQIVQRITKDKKVITEDIIGSLELDGYTVISYPNMEENADLLRIQSKKSIMSEHNEWNDAGKSIVSVLK